MRAKTLVPLVLLTAACSSDPTQIIVEIDAHPDVIARATQLELIVAGRPGVEEAEQFETSGIAERQINELDWPLRHVIAPRGEDAKRVFRLTVEALGNTESGFGLVSETRVTSSFLAEQTRYLRVYLPGDGCLGQRCSLDRRCVPAEDGAFECAELEFIDPSTLPTSPEKDAAVDAAPDADAGPICPQGEPCDVPEQPCSVGQWECGGDEPVCKRVGFKDVNFVCRPAGGECELDAQCDGETGVCPANPAKDLGSTCGAQADETVCIEGQCQTCVPDQPCSTGKRCEIGRIQCTDGVPACVGIGPRAKDTICRPKSTEPNTCDLEDVCDGTNLDCPDAIQPAGTECRPALGVCDIPEKCEADKKACPVDVRQPETYVCREPAGLCDQAEQCQGGVECPADHLKTAGAVCRASADNGTCDPAESCSGEGARCPENLFSPWGTACGDGNICDGLGSCKDLGCGDPCSPPTGASPCKKYQIDCNQDGRCLEVGNQEAGKACGDSTNTTCNGADTCDGNGNCQVNLAPKGTSCGPTGQPISECDQQNSCDGNGICQPNFSPPGTPCGSRVETECTKPDACDGGGACLPNHISNGARCDDGNVCTVEDACRDGACVSGPDRDCRDPYTCTVDYCNPNSNLTDPCVHELGSCDCLIEGKCYEAGQSNPDNGCMQCQPFTSRTQWTELSEGACCDSNGEYACSRKAETPICVSVEEYGSACLPTAVFACLP